MIISSMGKSPRPGRIFALALEPPETQAEARPFLRQPKDDGASAVAAAPRMAKRQSPRALGICAGRKSASMKPVGATNPKTRMSANCSITRRKKLDRPPILPLGLVGGIESQWGRVDSETAVGGGARSSLRRKRHH